MKKHYLRTLFEPKSVAIVGASERENSIGGQFVPIAVFLMDNGRTLGMGETGGPIRI